MLTVTVSGPWTGAGGRGRSLSTLMVSRNESRAGSNKVELLIGWFVWWAQVR